jgi:cyclophilin family peptidyl-prolyl cis-trans isomerase
MDQILNIMIVIILIVICCLLYEKFKNSNQAEQKIIYNKPKHKKSKHNSKHNSKHKFKHKLKQRKSKDDLVYLEIGTGGKKLGKIIIKLFSKIVPLTCENFRTLCINQSYKGTIFHRIIKNFMIQGGDFTNGDGTGGKSIFGKTFKDENFKLKHDKPYLLSMANKGKNTNGSQFFITTASAEHLDNKHVVFGKVINGFEVVDKLNSIKVDNEKPINDIVIINCGVV